MFTLLEIADSLFCEILTSILTSLSILDGVAHSEEPEFPGRASSFHSGVASLKQISPKQKLMFHKTWIMFWRYDSSALFRHRHYTCKNAINSALKSTSAKSASPPAAASRGSPFLMMASTAAGHSSVGLSLQISGARASTIASNVSGSSSWSIAAWNWSI